MIASLVGLALAAPQSYGGLGTQGPARGFGGGFALNNEVGFGASYAPCGPSQARDATGACSEAVFRQNYYVYAAPPRGVSYSPPPHIPMPKVDYNVIFVNTPEELEDRDPIVVPPPTQRTIVYVLTKNGQAGQQVIEVPAGPGEAPEVYYVNYDDGDNPELVGGVTLQEVLASQGVQDGSVIGGVSGVGAGGLQGVGGGGFDGVGLGGGCGGAGGLDGVGVGGFDGTG
ncbi:UNVERIFIED_CONTAM: hypothetical protein GTU68_032910, partial [Idotea baltica]|nr:hypothetical protein [Idotea baltica]